jgi:hypothetical protein
VTDAALPITEGSGLLSQSRSRTLTTVTVPIPEGIALDTAMLSIVPLVAVLPQGAPSVTPSA